MRTEVDLIFMDTFVKEEDGTSFSSTPPHPSAWALLLKWEMACNFLPGPLRVGDGTSLSSMSPLLWTG